MDGYTYPGVCMQEVPSAAHSITGVATSVGAFVGWAAKGSTTQAVLCQSFMDFQREYGGLDARSLLGYAVSHFFNNGGRQAYVVRVAQPTLTGGVKSTAIAGAASIRVTGGGVEFTAITPGAWSSAYGVLISGSTGTTFTASTVYAPSGTSWVILETLTGLSAAAIGTITSTYLSIESTGTPTAAPTNGLYMLSGGNDGNAVNVPGATRAAVTVFQPASTTAGFAFTAKNPGAWGNLLAVGATPQAGDTTNTRFVLQVLALGADGNVSVVETFYNLSVNATDPLDVVTVLNADSAYLTAGAVGTPTAALSSPFPSPVVGSLPFAGQSFLKGGYDGAVLDPTQDGADGGLFMAALNADGSGTGGVRLLDLVDGFNLLCVPGECESSTVQSLQSYCYNQRAFYIVDCPPAVDLATLMSSGPVGNDAGSLTAQYCMNSAYYYPWVHAPDPLIGGGQRAFPPCGFVAGIYAATDAARGVWTAPAGFDARLTGASGFQTTLTDVQNDALNIQGVNCLRTFKAYGDVVWGARTFQGNAQAGSQWKYVPIRRLALYLESSLSQGTQWVVFEPNDEALWSRIRSNVGSFMQGLFMRGAFQGTSPQQAYFVKCDAENNPQASIDQGIVNVLVGFAPLYPAEFVVIQIQQLTGQSS